ncbi:ribosome biogenesis GTP-binding protein YihA/YsxC [Marinicella sp. S1101]|uniref:ribosome biogenesis GTP-binding protein YihA/YsxC n=1 Tax=Marinicella marina TaxID=2996016 RepID=UPI0022609924|nr:ribosome biogenesis GTP-binding protein YihA/YsxC [Marinicella marina]MCX7553006.1 ribosome biogenesis GTP-binding protein YihA/YsxC [Marinicella marina]MDJ1139684.1 ribosome biogenesis GTP-binding protein YihA/YsxC [Marinicella marina]
MSNLFSDCKYLTSAYKINQLPDDEGMEIAFAGRSNSGKSTTINALTNHRGLAKVSKTPGRTQLFNCFEFKPNMRLVDLPGYGYAKVPLKMRKHWDKEIENYLINRDCLIGVVIIMDIRHPMKEFDEQMISWAHNSGLHSHVLLNKADKLNNSEIKKTLMKVTREIARFSESTTCQVFSALRKTGRTELSQILTPWFTEENN